MKSLKSLLKQTKFKRITYVTYKSNIKHMKPNFYNKDNNMELILRQDVQNLGFKDDIVSVKNGYGRNF
jgi:hypothetical protein